MKLDLVFRIAFFVLCLLLAPHPLHAKDNFSYAYSLASFNGIVPYNQPTIAIDKSRGEVYVVNEGKRSVSIFNESGMLEYTFGDNDDLGAIMALTILENGDIYLLTLDGGWQHMSLVQCNYRGDVQAKFKLHLSDKTLDFRPTMMTHWADELYLFDEGSMQAMVVNLQGELLRIIDLADIVGLDKQEALSIGLGGVDVGSKGEIYFTLPSEFRAYRLSPDGDLMSFGEPGSAPGKFNVIKGIASDKSGNMYIVDSLRCVVMVFGPDRRYLSEFGFFSYGPGGLVYPQDILVSNNGYVYVTQRSFQGVRVFIER